MYFINPNMGNFSVATLNPGGKLRHMENLKCLIKAVFGTKAGRSIQAKLFEMKGRRLRSVIQMQDW